MTQTSHTPGPWHIKPMDNGYGLQVFGNDGKRIIGAISSNGAGIRRASAKVKSDSNLIATAPELLHALESLVEACSTSADGRDFDWPSLMGSAHAAIAKARGD